MRYASPCYLRMKIMKGILKMANEGLSETDVVDVFVAYVKGT